LGGLVENDIDERLVRERVDVFEHLAGDLDQEGFQLPGVPAVEDLSDLRCRHAEGASHDIVRFGDQLHIAIFDSVMHHFYVVPGTTGADIGHTGTGAGFRRDGGQHRFQFFPGIFRTARHEAWSPEGAFLAAGHTHAHEVEAEFRHLSRTTLGVGEERVATVDDDIAFLKVGSELLNDRVDGRSSLHQEDDSARPLQRVDEFLNGGGADNILALGALPQELLGAGRGAVVDNRRESVTLDVERKVLAHDGETNHANMPAAGGFCAHVCAPSFPSL